MTKILMTGGTGLVGKALQQKFSSEDEVYILTRSDKENHDNITYINWDKENYEQYVPDVDLIINLAGASLNQRWTKEHKEAIQISRIESTRKLLPIIDNMQSEPLLISASAVGYYPPSNEVVYSEQDTISPFDFLSETVHLWEKEAKKIEHNGNDVAYVRFGVIFSDKGGALPLMIKPYQLFAGGPIGKGTQPYSWIHLDDLVDAILYIYKHRLTGIYNLTAPYPVTQQQLGKVIAETIHRPHYFVTPTKLIELLLGEQSIMVTKGQKVLPEKLLAHGFKFSYPNVKIALSDLLRQS